MKSRNRLFAIALAVVVSSAAILPSYLDVTYEDNFKIHAAEQESLPVFSSESGFYGTDFALTLSVAGDGDIYYTTDGTDPCDSETSQLYSGPVTVKDRTNEPNLYSKYEENGTAQSVSRGIGYKKPTFNVDKATVVRAVVKNTDGTYGSTVNHTYFITSGKLSQYKNMTVVSLVTNPDNLFDPDKGIYVTGNQYIDWQNSSSYNPEKSVWDTDNITNYFSRGREWEREADITIFESGSVAVKQGMGIRIKGASTRNSAQKSFNLYARSEYGASKIKNPLLPGNYSIDGKLIEKYDSISLRSVGDEVRLRDSFAQGLVHDRENLTTEDMKPCVVFLNGEYWGMYEMAEKLSDYFIESNYGIDKKDVAMLKNGEQEEGAQEESDNFLNFAYSYAQKNLTDDTNYKKVCDFIDIDSMIEHYAAGLYLGTFDWPNYNYAVWRNTGEAIDGNKYSDGKWRFISFDYDYTMGATYGSFGGVEGYQYDSFLHMDKSKKGAPTCLFVKLLKNEDFRNRFAAVYCDYANEVLTEKKANNMADRYATNYSDMLASTQLRWWGFFGGTPDGLIPYYKRTYQNETLNGIRTFFSKRAEYTLNDMKEYTGLQGTLQTVSLKADGNGKIQINSIVPDISQGKWTGKYYSDCPVTLTAIPDDGKIFTGWSGDVNSSSMTITVTPEQAVNIQANFSDSAAVEYDVNTDGIFNCEDIIMMQKFLLGAGELNDWKAGDMDGNDNINIVDLCLIKEALLNL